MDVSPLSGSVSPGSPPMTPPIHVASASSSPTTGLPPSSPVVMTAAALKATKLKLSADERLRSSSLLSLCLTKYSANDVRDGMSVDTAFLYEQIQGKLRRRVRPKILILMRSRMQAGIFAQVLINHGCEVIVCTNGHKAYTSYLRKNSADFSLCLCQWYIPGIAGRDLAYYEAESGGRLPFVALLGHGQRASDAVRSGADLFFKLPMYPHLRWILSLVLPHTSALTQIKVGAMASNFESLRRLLGQSQDVMHHTIETNLLTELVKEDLAQIAELPSMDVGINMLEAVMAGIRSQDAALAAARRPQTPSEDLTSSPVKRAAKRALKISGKGGGKMGQLAQDMLEKSQLEASKQLDTKDAHYRTLAQSFRNVMMVLGKVRTTLIHSQLENHTLREQQARNQEQADLLKGQLRSMGMDIAEVKLERLYLPRCLTRSPPPPGEPTVSELPLHAQVAADVEVDATQFNKQELMRALRAARSALTTSNEEISMLADELRRLQEYQVEIEDDLVSRGVAVHFHLGGNNSFSRAPSASFVGAGGGDEAGRSNGSPTASTASHTGGGGTRHAEEALKQALARKRSVKQLHEEKLVRTLSMMGPRLQDEYFKQQLGGSMPSSKLAGGAQRGGTTNDAELDSGLLTPRNGTAGAVDGGERGVEHEVTVQKHKRKQEAIKRRFFARLYCWASYVNRNLEKQAMAAEDTRSVNVGRVKPVAPVPRCTEKATTTATNALDALSNGVIELHNSVATDVNLFTAKISATAPQCNASLQQLSTSVKNNLQAFNVAQHIASVQLFVEGKIMKLLSDERAVWAKEKAEMEKYKVQNPPNSRKMITDLKFTVRELRFRRWKDWFHTVELKVRSNYFHKWIMWLLQRRLDKKWTNNLKDLEADIHASTSKKLQDQYEFKKRQSMDVMAKQSQQRIEQEQLQLKYNRISSLYEEVNSKFGPLKKENEKLERELEELANKKVLQDEVIMEKADTILQLTLKVSPLEEEIASLKATVAARDQKASVLMSQVAVLQKKVQAASGRTSALNVSTKMTQTAISNSNAAAELNAIVTQHLKKTYSFASNVSGTFDQLDLGALPAANDSGEHDHSTPSDTPLIEEPPTPSNANLKVPRARSRSVSGIGGLGGGHTPMSQSLSANKSQSEKNMRSASISGVSRVKSSTTMATPRTDSLLTPNGGGGAGHAKVPTGKVSSKGKSGGGGGAGGKSVALLPRPGGTVASASASFSARTASDIPVMQPISLEDESALAPPSFMSTPQTMSLQRGTNSSGTTPSPPPLGTFSHPDDTSNLLPGPSPGSDDEHDGLAPRALSGTMHGNPLSESGKGGSSRRISGESATSSSATNSGKRTSVSSTVGSIKHSPLAPPDGAALVVPSNGGSQHSRGSRKRSVSLTGKDYTTRSNNGSFSGRFDDGSSVNASTETPEAFVSFSSHVSGEVFGTHPVLVDGGCSPMTPPEVTQAQTETSPLVMPTLVDCDVQATDSVTIGATSPMSIPSSAKLMWDDSRKETPVPLKYLDPAILAAKTTKDEAVGGGDASTPTDEAAAAYGEAKRKSLNFVVPAMTNAQQSQQLSNVDSLASSSHKMDLNDSSTWHSALKELRRRPSGVTSGAVSPNASSSINGVLSPPANYSLAIQDVVDSARKLLDQMSIPQTILTKSSSEADMLDKLKLVLDAASVVFRKRQTQQQQQAEATNAASPVIGNQANGNMMMSASGMTPKVPGMAPPGGSSSTSASARKNSINALANAVGFSNLSSPNTNSAIVLVRSVAESALSVSTQNESTTRERSISNVVLSSIPTLPPVFVASPQQDGGISAWLPSPHHNGGDSDDERQRNKRKSGVAPVPTKQRDPSTARPSNLAAGSPQKLPKIATAREVKAPSLFVGSKPPPQQQQPPPPSSATSNNAEEGGAGGREATRRSVSYVPDIFEGDREMVTDSMIEEPRQLVESPRESSQHHSDHESEYHTRVELEREKKLESAALSTKLMQAMLSSSKKPTSPSIKQTHHQQLRPQPQLGIGTPEVSPRVQSESKRKMVGSHVIRSLK